MWFFALDLGAVSFLEAGSCYLFQNELSDYCESDVSRREASDCRGTSEQTMRCIFCKQNSSDSKSVEHILPESLGNTTLTLPKGVVCDKCNNYFARKIEAPFFQLTGINELRFYEGLPNKSGKIPSIRGIVNGASVELHRKNSSSLKNVRGETMLLECDPQDIDRIINANKMITLAFNDAMIPRESKVISRFLAKVAFESLTNRVLSDTAWPEFIIDNPSFDGIRNYVRMGGEETWPYSIRRIYDMDQRFFDNADGEFYQVVYEEDFLLIPEKCDNVQSGDELIPCHLYFVMAWFGMEFVMNMAGNDASGLEAYNDWLHEHNGASPLYVKNKKGRESST